MKYQDIVNSLGVNKLQSLASNPTLQAMLDKIVGGATLGYPISEIPSNIASRADEAKAIINNPVGEWNKYKQVEMNKPLKQSIDENMGMIVGMVGSGNVSRYEKYLDAMKKKSKVKLFEQTKALQEHINSPRVKPKTPEENILKKMVEENGGVYKGIQRDVDGNAIVHFSDAKLATDLPMSLDTNNLTPEIIKQKIYNKSRESLASTLKKYRDSKGK